MQLKVAYSVFLAAGWFAAAGLAQEPYSADSLMAAFEKTSQSSLKGVEITFSGVVTEATSSRVMFKSSRNDRVICELVATMRQGNPNTLIGSPLTVVGKVRGRGMLGNVTLDQCRVYKPVDVAVTESAVVEHVEEAAEPAVATTETPESTAPVADAVSATSPPTPAPVKVIKTVAVAPKPLVLSDEAAQRTPEETIPIPATDSKSANSYWQGVIHTLLAIGIGIGGVFVLVRVQKAIVLRRTTRDLPTTPEMRRAALEQLLLAKKGRSRNARP